MKSEIIKINKWNSAQKRSVYDDFITWTSLPQNEKVSLGLETQKAFAEYHKVQMCTLSNWKKRADFRPRVREMRREWGFDNTTHVLQSVFKSAIKGNPMSQAIWLKYFEEFETDNKKNSGSGSGLQKVEVTVNDIRFIIDGLSKKEDREKYYAIITELLIKADEERNAGLFEDGYRSDGAPGEIYIETDIVTQDVPVKRANAISRSYPEGLCGYVERKVSKSNYQSAERWWEE